MPKRCGRYAFLGLVLLASGCGSGGLVATTGKVTINGNPLPNATVELLPTGDTPANQKAFGRSDDQGVFTLTNRQGKKGLQAGTYKAVVSKRLNPDGSEPDPNAPPIESAATERLPAKYSDPDKTQLEITIEADKPLEIKLEVPGWK
jgi:glycine/D-amino acid oxidase-like deaminating enzyme